MRKLQESVALLVAGITRNDPIWETLPTQFDYGAFLGNGLLGATIYRDGDEATRWGAAPNSRSGWLEVDLGTTTQVSRAVVKELEFPRTEQFAIEYKDGESWKPVFTGTTLEGGKSYDVPPVSARFFRLNILKANEVPTIEEVQFLNPKR
jgi:hypothetical protein